MLKPVRTINRLWLFCAALLLAPGAWAQLLTDDFNATTLPYSLSSAGGWAAHSGIGNNVIQATAPSLTYAGLTTTGGSAALTTTGEDVNRKFTEQSSGSVYASFLVNVSSAQSAGDYFLHLGPTTLGNTFVGRVFVKSGSGGIQFGVAKSSDTPVYASTVYSTGTTYLLVLKYTFVAGATNDVVDLFIQPTLGQPEPSPTTTAVSTTTDLTNAGTIALRQGTASSAPGLRVDYIRIGTAWSDVTSLSAPTASLTASPNALTGFSTTTGTPSAAQSYTLTAANVANQTITVSAPAGFEVSLAQSVSFATTQTIIPQTNDPASPVIYVRLTGAATGTFSGTITNTINSTLTAPVTVSGQTNAPNAPSLTVNPTALTNFTATQGTASAEQSYTISATNLTGSLSVSAPAGVEVSQTSGSGFATSLTLPASTTSAVVYVRLTGAAAGPISGTITNVSNGLTASVAVNGTINSNTPYTPIATARLGVGQSFLIAGRVTASSQLGARQIYVQDNTGGLIVYSGSAGTDLTTQVQIGDSVQAGGPIAVYNGAIEINGVTGFTVVSGVPNRVPTPIAITLDQLPNYQGRLVSVADVSISGTGATFASGNYTLTANGQSATLRISANSPLAGAGRPANPVSVTGIADRFVSGATTTGTNGVQLQPRVLADIPGATPAQDQICTVPGSTTLTPAQTLDIAAWNFEFFGANAGYITCPGNVTYTYANQGPANEDLQQANATTVLTKLNADIISAEEISDINRFDATVKSLPGSYSYVCSDKFSYYFQDQCDQQVTNGTVFGPTSLAQKVCVIYNTATVTPILAETKPLLLNKSARYTYPGGDGWASGRLPFLFVANATINGVTKKIHVVALHAKSGSAAADFNRRKQDFDDLKAELDANYPNANIVMLGDYNDRATASIYTGSSVSSFNSFVADAADYNVLTAPLEQQNCATYNPSGGSFIDHIITSNDLQPAYVANSAYVFQPFSIPNYVNTTSDHNPIVARFDLSRLAPAPVITVTPSSLSLLVGAKNLTQGVHSYTVSASNLTDDLTVTAPESFYLARRDQLGNGYQKNLTLTPVNGVVPPTEILVFLFDRNNTAGIITNVSGSATATVAVSATLVDQTVTVSPTALTGFTTTVGTPSAIQSYTLTTRGELRIYVDAPDGFEIRAGNDPFGPSLIVEANLNQIVTTVVDVRLKGTSIGAVSGAVSNVAKVAGLIGGEELNYPVAVSGTVLGVSAPSITVTPSSLSLLAGSLDYPQQTSQSYTVSASNVTDNLIITTDRPFYIRRGDQPNSTYERTVTLTPINGVVPPTQIQVVLMGSPGTYTGIITNASGSATATVALSGTSVGQTVTVSPTALTGFTTTVGTPSAIQSYTLTTRGELPVYVTPPAGFEIRIGNNPFSTSYLTIPASLTYVNTQVDVRLTGAAVGDVSGNVTNDTYYHSGHNSYTVAVSGTVIAIQTPVITVTPSSLTLVDYREYARLPQSYTVSASNLTTDLTITAPPSYYVSLNASPGYSSGSIKLPATNGAVPPTRIFVGLVASSPGSYSGVVTNVSGSATATVAVSGTVIGESVTVSPTALSSFTTTVGTPSASQSYTITSRGGLSVVVQAPEGFEIRTGTNPFSRLLIVDPSLSYVNTTVDVRLTGAVVGPVSGTISNETHYQSGDGTYPVAVSGTVLPVATAPFAITDVTTVSCQTLTAGLRRVTLVPQYAGLNGQAVTFSVRNETLPTTNAGPYSLNLYTDNPVITLQAEQSGVTTTFSYNWLAACNTGTNPPTNTPPTVASPIGSQSATVGQAFSFAIPSSTFTDAETPGQLTLSVSGLPAGLSYANGVISGTPSTSGVSTVTVTATDPGGLSASTQFTLTVGPASGTGTFAIVGVTTVSCATLSAGERSVTFSPQYSGLNGQAVTFSVRNETLPTTSPGPYTLRLYTDNPVITLLAQQAGTSGTAQFSYNWLTACNTGTNPPNNTPPTVTTPIADLTVTAGQPVLYNVANNFTDPEGQPLRFSAAGLNGTSVSINERTGVISGTFPTTTGSPFSVTVTATDPGGLSVSTQFNLTVLPASSTGTFTITGATTVDCQTTDGQQYKVTLVPQYAGLNGQPITFSVRNETLPTTNAGPYTLRLYRDNPVITLQAVQSGVTATYTYNWLAACNAGSARSGTEQTPVLSVSVLGNPVAGETVDVEVRGAAGEWLQLQTLDTWGHVVGEAIVEQATATERVTLRLGRTAGVYLLHVSTPARRQVLKVVKQ